MHGGPGTLDHARRTPALAPLSPVAAAWIAVLTAAALLAALIVQH